MLKNKDLISKMTLQEKASLMSGKNYWETIGIKKHGVPSMYLADGPHGIRKQSKSAEIGGLNSGLPATCFPTSSTMANSWDNELCEQMSKRLGEEGLYLGVNVVLGPGINLKRNPLCGRNFEYFSEDPYLSGKLGSSYIKGIQSNGIASCAKHLICNNQETRRKAIDTIIDERAFRELYLTSFEIAIKEGKAQAIMSSYNKVNGSYCNENFHLMHGIVRNTWNYKGAVISDWGGSNDRVKGLIAGNDLEMPTTCGESNNEIIKAIKEGKIKESNLDESVDRLLSLALETNKSKQKPLKNIDYEEHHLFAQKCAEESMVLLKNKNNVLPLEEENKIAIVGDFAFSPRYQGGGSSVVNPTKLDSVYKVIKEYPLNVIGFAQGFDRYGKNKRSLIKEAIKLCAKAEVILLFLGLDETKEFQGFDRENMRLPKNQIVLVKELAKLNKKIIVVLSCGAPIEMEFEPIVDGILHTYLAGQAGARAILNVLTNKVNPSGKLAESYPLSYNDCPSSNTFAKNTNSVEYRESIFVGYRYYDTANVSVLYPFGFGLSYTTFEYSELFVGKNHVSFCIQNIGKYLGAEIAQLYVGKQESDIFRPSKELKGFKKVFLMPGEKTKVRIPFDDKTFRYFNVNTNSFEIEKGIYQIMIGASVADIKLKGEIELEGTDAKNPYDKINLASYYSGKVVNIKKDEFEDLLRRKVPNPNRTFYKKNRLIVNYNTTVDELRYSKGWTGRSFALFIRFLIWFLKLIKQRDRANILIMGILHEPMRSLSRMTNGFISWGQLDALIYMFNGHYHKGLFRFFRAKINKKNTVNKYKKELKESEN